jgi:hypothetical protein
MSARHKLRVRLVEEAQNIPAMLNQPAFRCLQRRFRIGSMQSLDRGIDRAEPR